MLDKEGLYNAQSSEAKLSKKQVLYRVRLGLEVLGPRLDLLSATGWKLAQL